MNIRLAFVVVLAWTIAFPVSAAPAAQEASAKEKKIRRLLEMSGTSAMGQQVVDTMADHFSKAPDLPAGFIQKLREAARPDALIDSLVPIYVKNLDDETLDATIAFFESPAGKKFTKAQPLIMKESMEATQKWSTEAAQKALKAVEK